MYSLKEAYSLEALQHKTFLLGGNYVAGYTKAPRCTFSREFPFFECNTEHNGSPIFVTPLKNP